MDYFFGTACMPWRLSNTPYFVVVCQGYFKYDNDVVGSNVRRSHVYKLLTCLLWHSPYHQHFRENDISLDLLQDLPENSVLDAVIIKESDNVMNNMESEAIPTDDSAGQLDINVYVPHSQGLEVDMVQKQLGHMRNSSINTKQEEQYQCPSIGFKPIDDFNTPGLASMCFPELFLDGKGYPAHVARLRDNTLANYAKHLMKFCV